MDSVISTLSITNYHSEGPPIFNLNAGCHILLTSSTRNCDKASHSADNLLPNHTLLGRFYMLFDVLFCRFPKQMFLAVHSVSRVHRCSVRPMNDGLTAL